MRSGVPLQYSTAGSPPGRVQRPTARQPGAGGVLAGRVASRLRHHQAGARRVARWCADDPRCPPARPLRRGECGRSEAGARAGCSERRQVPTSPRAASDPTPSSPSTTARSGPTATMWCVLRLWCHRMRRSARSPHGGPPRRTAVRRVVVAVGSRRHAAGRNHAPDPAQPAIYARVMEHIVPESQRTLFDAWHLPAVVHDGIAFERGHRHGP